MHSTVNKSVKNKPDLVEKKETKMGTLYCDFLKQS